MLLSEFTTMRVGGPAESFSSPASEVDLVATARSVWATDIPWLLLGGGSNVVIADEGFDGAVIRVATRGLERLSGDAVRIRVQAGEPWDAVVERAVTEGWAGIEALSGIPGSSGAAPIQNIGAYGQEVASTLVAIDFLDHRTGAIERVPAAELGFGYRTSALKRGRLGLVVAIELQLEASQLGVVGYPQVASALDVPLGGQAPLADIRSAVLALRASKGMVLDPDDPDSVSCGSFFTNPIVSENFARGLPASAPRWPVTPELAHTTVPIGEAPAVLRYSSDTEVKLSAAWLIEHAGISKGFALPGSRAAISSKHPLAIVNRGGATASQVAELARFVLARVRAEFGILLQVEPVAVGVEI
jgi:UDP-N-acetylmuramate dehydrogenase